MNRPTIIAEETTLLENILRKLQEEEGQEKACRITLATKESLELVAPGEIAYCESDSNYTMVHLADGRRKLISRTLREFEELLSPFNFYRPHYSYLVNMDHVREFVRVSGGYLVLKNQAKIPVAKSRREGLMAYFNLRSDPRPGWMPALLQLLRVVGWLAYDPST